MLAREMVILVISGSATEGAQMTGIYHIVGQVLWKGCTEEAVVASLQHSHQ
jgi:hypothetical protein